MNKLTCRPDIDGLRAIAIILVIVFHSTANLLRGGFIRVDIFFVISSYLISRIILDISIAGLDKEMNKLAQKLQISYVSIFNTLCDNNGCLAYINGPEGKALTTFDRAHLTFESAMYMVNKALIPILSSSIQRNQLISKN